MTAPAAQPGAERRGRPCGRLRVLRDVFFRLLRFVAGHVRGFYGAVAATLSVTFLVGVAAATSVFLLGHVVMAGATQEFDEAVLRWAARRRTPVLDRAMLEITTLGDAVVLVAVVAVAALFLWLTRHRYSVGMLALALLGALVVTDTLKDLYGRPRPAVVPWVTVVGSPSFPSGHAFAAFVVYGTIAYLVSRLEASRALRRLTWTLAVLIVLLVGASRVYLGVHYPSDVLAGFAAALAWIAFVASGLAAVRYFARRRPALAREERDLGGGAEAAGDAVAGAGSGDRAAGESGVRAGDESRDPAGGGARDPGSAEPDGRAGAGSSCS